ncbi:glycosyl hydrolase family 3 N terminal domain-containing protein [Gongronella butleri]|nr:glycosyl hydrolase family 3 N terminal domain-containing protein [Gongronella butleri]
MHITSIAAASLVVLQALNVNAQRSWDDAYALAKPLVDKMSLVQKLNVTTGIGWTYDCLGQTAPTTNPDFPGLCYQDSPLGIRFAHNVTVFPAGITTAATFDKKLILQRGEAMGEEFRGKGAHIQLGPAMNFMRSPEGGRGWESFGEEPFLTGVAAAETITGIQSKGVIATAKHFIMNDQELHRKASSSDADDRTIHEVYLWPFARSVEAGVGAVMCSYNQINGKWACENPEVLSILRDELGFRGMIMSDWWAAHSTVDSANAGMDVDMPGNDYDQGAPSSLGNSFWGDSLYEAVKNGSVPESRVTDSATRVVAAHYKMLQDKGFPKTTLDSFNLTSGRDTVNVKADHPKVARDVAAAGTVLLTNNGILPLTKKNNNIAIIGQDAFWNDALTNVNNQPCPDFGCDPATLIEGWGSGTVSLPTGAVAPYDGIKNRAGKNVKFTTQNNNYDMAAVKKAAQAAEIAIVFGNTDSGEEYISVDGNVGDRNNLTLWQNGDEVIKTVADNNKNTIVVIHSVGATLMPWINHPNIKAVVWANVPGEQSGNALADILYGDVNPSGRLPYTIAKQESDYPVKPDPNFNVEYSEKLLIGYRWYDAHNVEPLFPFGHGLSYTKFQYSKLNVRAGKAHGHNSSPSVSASVTVSNSGHVDGNEVVQLYLSFPASAGEPPKVLRGFEKVEIRAGHSEHVNFQLGKTELSIWDASKKAWVVPSGKFTVHIGASSRDIRASADFTL